MWLREPTPCLCCGKPVQCPPADLLALSLHLTPVQTAILHAVIAGRREAVPTDRILCAIYTDDPTPPPAARMYATFKEKLSLMRPVLARVGLGIENMGRFGGIGCFGWPMRGGQRLDVVALCRD